jgi:NAD(P)-dependent dehydrogenase (short-subunit alcohol dehydrogenase family)
MPRMNLQDVSAIVTGGASGLGEACARQLADLGARVVIADLQEDRGKEIAAEIGGIFVMCDVTKEEDVAASIVAASELGPLRVLVNSAGISRAARTVDRDNNPMPQATFDLVIRVNLLGTFNMLRQAAVAMAKTEPYDADGARGVIVNMASVAAFDGQTGQAPYSASKAAIVGMTLPIARDLSAIGVRVNTVAPGLIDTPIYGVGERAEAFKAKLTETVQFPKRLGSPEELAFTVMECITNPYLNAEVIRVDGGVRFPPK